MKPNNCPMCGSPAQIDSTAVAESYYDWQTITIECTDITNKCGMHIEIQADMHYANDSWNKLIELWNSFKRPVSILPPNESKQP